MTKLCPPVDQIVFLSTGITRFNDERCIRLNRCSWLFNVGYEPIVGLPLFVGQCTANVTLFIIRIFEIFIGSQYRSLEFIVFRAVPAR